MNYSRRIGKVKNQSALTRSAAEREKECPDGPEIERIVSRLRLVRSMVVVLPRWGGAAGPKQGVGESERAAPGAV
jgi:hypothetical protein